MSINDGGQAFPTHPILYGSADQHLAQGMSLRDWFAGQTAAAIIGGLTASQTNTDADDAKAVAVASYLMADAMLAARNSTPTKGD
jgi:hypothetical protein